MPTAESGAEKTYATRRDAFGVALAEAVGRSTAIGRARVAVFGAAVVALLLFETASPRGRMALLLGTAALALVFLTLVAAHSRSRARERWLGMRMQLCDEGIDRLHRRWAHLPELGPPPEEPHPYAGDLDLFGRASLSRLLGSVTTTPGRGRLRAWLLDPSPPAAVAERQAAVSELVGLHDLRETLSAWGRIVGSPTPQSIDRLLAWAESEGSMLPAWARVAGWVLPILTLGLVVADLQGSIVQPLWLIPAATALVVSARLAPRIHDEFRQISAGEVGVAHYARLLRPLVDEDFEAPLLAGVRESLGAGGLAAPDELGRLLRLVHLADVWRNAMMYWPLQIMTLWDFHVAARLEAWRSHCGHRLRDWVDTLGDVDALGGLATLHFENPGWEYPDIEDEADRVVARGLVHPYLDPAVAVANDVAVGPPGTFLLVTGSNMSGKSTLLRAIGVNVVLARAGGPVAARSMTLPPVRLETSIRVQDSLEEGVSLFMAELQSLKAVVNAAREDGGLGVLYLLDEILQGTNTAERQIAARTVIRHLLNAGAIGAVTTHDLHLADAPDLAARSRPVHFTETFVREDAGPRLDFDYRLREGLATSTNALTLMELVGLRDTEAPSAQRPESTHDPSPGA